MCGHTSVTHPRGHLVFPVIAPARMMEPVASSPKREGLGEVPLPGASGRLSPDPIVRTPNTHSWSHAPAQTARTYIITCARTCQQAARAGECWKR